MVYSDKCGKFQYLFLILLILQFVFFEERTWLQIRGSDIPNLFHVGATYMIHDLQCCRTRVWTWTRVRTWGCDSDLNKSDLDSISKNSDSTPLDLVKSCTDCTSPPLKFPRWYTHCFVKTTVICFCDKIRDVHVLTHWPDELERWRSHDLYLRLFNY
jgi:hypothetical protein